MGSLHSGLLTAQGKCVPRLLGYGALHEGIMPYLVLSAGQSSLAQAHVTSEMRRQAGEALQVSTGWAKEYVALFQVAKGHARPY